MPLANDTRVRVDGRSKTSATTFPSRSGGQPSRTVARRWEAYSRIAATAPGSWWRNVRSDRPRRDGSGVKAGSGTGRGA